MVKGQMKAGSDDMRALCPDRGQRDNRTIDQIQRDIKARKAIGPSKTTNGAKQKSPDKESSTINRSHSRPMKRPPSPTPSTSSSSSSASDVPRKRPKPNDEKTRVSAMIQELFRRPDRPPPRRVYSDEESGSGSDMEAGLSDVEEEEQRALRVARREDELAEREERERKARKEKLRKEREGR
jgi:protein SPT2